MARPLRRAYFLSLCFMKKILTFLFIFASLYLSAQEYKPRETWPFLYEYFTEGATRTRAGDLVSDAQFNISVLDGTLMYISKDNTIMQADMRSVFTARIGDEAYLNLSGKLYRILSELDKGIVLYQEILDEDALGKVSIGYGVQSSAGSADNLQILMHGRFNLVNQTVEHSSAEKYSGAVLPVKETRYLLVNGLLIPATRSSVISWPGVDKKEASAFIKAEKIKWKETASLEKLVIFLNQQLNK